MKKKYDILLNGKKNVIWGAGVNGKELLVRLLHYAIPIECFCDSNTDLHGVHILNKKIVSPDEIIHNKEKYNIIVSPSRGNVAENIIFLIKQHQITEYLTWEELICCMHEPEYRFHLLFQIMRDAKDKQIILYGCNYKAWSLKIILEQLDCSIKYMVADIEKEHEMNGIKVKPVHDLGGEEKPENTFVLVTTEVKKDCNYRISNLEKMGFRYGCNYIFVDFYQKYTAEYVLDPHLGYSGKKGNNEAAGIMKWGEEDNITIAILGNSTTEADVFDYKSWPQFLYERLKAEGYKVTVLNAGCAGYMSSQELLKLERDLLPYKPDIVLSYSGVNDGCKLGNYEKRVQYPFDENYQIQMMEKMAGLFENDWYVYMRGTGEYTLGIEHRLETWDVYLNNIKMEYAICKEFNVHYQCFLQPSLVWKRDFFTVMEKELFINSFGNTNSPSLVKASEFYNEVVKRMDERYMTDVTNLFVGHAEVWDDCVHVNETGNRMIADYMYYFLVEKGWIYK